MKLKLLLCILALSVGLSATPSTLGHHSSGHGTERPKPTDHTSARKSGSGIDNWQGRGQRKRDQDSAKERQRNDKDFERGRRNAGHHWNGNRFDQHFFAGHFGMYHPFFFGGPGFFWYGNPCLFGSTFAFGDIYFGLEYPCTAMWLGYPWDGVYIDEGPEGYVLVNPAFPGVTFGVKVIM